MSYRTFGYIPQGRMRANWQGKLMSHPNLIKRLQAPDVISSMELCERELILDAGCGYPIFSFLSSLDLRRSEAGVLITASQKG